MYFEPENPITNEGEFTDEIIKFCDRENRDLVILEESMEPIALIDEEKYVCKLGNPLQVMNKLFKIPIMNTPFNNQLGYKWVYIYKINE